MLRILLPTLIPLTRISKAETGIHKEVLQKKYFQKVNSSNPNRQQELFINQEQKERFERSGGK